MPLNPKQQAFVREYLVDRNATQAAIRAGYSAKTAGSQGFDLLKKPEIAAAVEAKTEKQARKLELTAESVLEDLLRLAKKAEDAGELGTAIKGRELLGKHLRLFVDKVEVSGQLTLEQLVAAAAAKRKGG